MAPPAPTARQGRKTITLDRRLFEGEDQIGTIPCLLVLLSPLAMLAGIAARVLLFVL